MLFSYHEPERDESRMEGLIEALRSEDDDRIRKAIIREPRIRRKIPRTESLDAQLWAAVTRGDVGAAEALVLRGAELVDIKYEMPVFHRIAKSGSAEMGALFLAMGTNIDQPDELGTTALHVAVTNENMEFVEFLISRGADLNSAKEDGVTALHLAARAGQADVIEALCKGGADVNAPDEMMTTPLRLASSLGHSDAVRVLLAHGADPLAPDSCGFGALHNAAWGGNEEVYEILRSSVAATHGRDADDVECANGLTTRMMARLRAIIGQYDGEPGAPEPPTKSYGNMEWSAVTFSHSARKRQSVPLKKKGGIKNVQ